MKIKEGFLLRKMDGMGVVAPVGKASERVNGMATLNETGILLWETMQRETSRQELIQALLAAYEVSEERAAQDVDVFLHKAREAGLVEE